MPGQVFLFAILFVALLNAYEISTLIAHDLVIGNAVGVSSGS